MKWCLLVLSVFLGLVLKAQLGFNPPFEREPGKCYAMCQLPSKFRTVEVTYFVYIGDDEVEDNDNLEIVMAGYEHGGREWVQMENIKTGHNRGGRVWCLVERPHIEGEEIIVVKDTLWTKDFVEETYTEVHYSENGDNLGVGFLPVWKEILCENKVNPRLLLQIENALFRKGHYKAKFVGRARFSFDTEFRAALNDFQKANNLPVGNLNLETLDHLGIKY